MSSLLLPGWTTLRLVTPSQSPSSQTEPPEASIMRCQAVVGWALLLLLVLLS
jgi:hypothetical protein